MTKFLSSFTFKFWLAVCAALLACLPLAYCKGRSDGAALKQAQIDRATTKAVTKARAADQTASARRAADNERIENASAKREDAARTGGRTGANCERLRAAYPNRPIPACD